MGAWFEAKLVKVTQKPAEVKSSEANKGSVQVDLNENVTTESAQESRVAVETGDGEWCCQAVDDGFVYDVTFEG